MKDSVISLALHEDNTKSSFECVLRVHESDNLQAVHIIILYTVLTDIISASYMLQAALAI